jgi:hypothetical protein
MTDNLVKSRIKKLTKSYSKIFIMNELCKTLDVSQRSMYRYINSIDDMPVSKALLLFQILNIHVIDLPSQINDENFLMKVKSNPLTLWIRENV